MQACLQRAALWDTACPWCMCTVARSMAGQPWLEELLTMLLKKLYYSNSWDLVLKSSVVINKLHKAIPHTLYIYKNDNYLKQREISILYKLGPKAPVSKFSTTTGAVGPKGGGVPSGGRISSIIKSLFRTLQFCVKTWTDKHKYLISPIYIKLIPQ